MGTLLHTQDWALWNSVASEVNRLAGINCYYYVLNRNQSVIDSVYGEIGEEVFWSGPVILACNAENPEKTASTREEGKEIEWDMQIWIAQRDFESGMKSAGITISSPQYGDVVKLWDWYYDIVEYDMDGIMDDEKRAFSMYKLKLRRKTSFEAERRTKV